MHKTVKFHQNQQGIYGDHNDAQAHVKQTFDHLIADAVTSQSRFAGFSATKDAATLCAITPGRLYVAGAIYTKEDIGNTIDFFSTLPLSTEKIVAIVASGAEVETEDEERKFLIDATTRATQIQTVPTTVHRVATLSTVAGTESASPVKPTVSSDLVTIAWVTLDTIGIKSIEMNTAAQIESIQNNDARLIDMESWRGSVGNRLDTLATDISGLAQQGAGRGDSGLAYQLASDVARLKELNELEDSHTDYGADRYLTDGESDTDHVNYLATVEEGVRFSNDGEDEFALELFNPINPDIVVSNGFLLPKYTERRRLLIDTFYEELSISQYAYQTVNYVERTMSRTRIRYGNSKTTCTNSTWWRAGTYDPVSNIFTKAGDTWEVVSGDPLRNHRHVRLRRFWSDTYEETYWDRIVNNASVNGSVVAQTFLNSQVGWMTSLDLYLHQVGPSGDLHILLTKTKNGKPDADNVLATATLAYADMAVGWNNLAWPATLLSPGARYGVILVTGGNHYVGLAEGARYAQGTLFYSTDGAFYQGDLTKDVMFGVNCAEFDYNRVEVEMDALSLSGGISDIDLMAEMAVPEGTALSFEIQPGGSGAWLPIEEVASGNTVLYGLPALCKFRAVFTGTPDAHPGINLTTSRMNISRPRTTLTHISEAVTLASATQSFKVNVLLENYYETNHDLTCVIDDVTNATAGIAAATVTDVDLGPDPQGTDANHKRIRRTFEWTAAEITLATSEIVIQLDGATSSALDTFHVSERVHLAF